VEALAENVESLRQPIGDFGHGGGGISVLVRVVRRQVSGRGLASKQKA
jgi:hypothetical protein